MFLVLHLVADSRCDQGDNRATPAQSTLCTTNCEWEKDQPFVNYSLRKRPCHAICLQTYDLRVDPV